MVEEQRAGRRLNVYSSIQILMIFLLKLPSVPGNTSVTSKTVSTEKKVNNHSCYTCVEPLVGYTDFPDSCRFFNTNSPLAASYIKQCNEQDDGANGGTGEYECRKLIISYRSVDTYVRRDCAPKGLCSWKDKTQSMNNTPVSNCVYTDDHAQRLECIYCCDTPLCNRTRSFNYSNVLLLICVFSFYLRKRN